MIEGGREVYEFDEFRLDALKRQLTREGEVVPIYSKAFDLLLALVQNAGRDLTKDELLEKVWPGQILEESNLPVNISAVRRALGETANDARYIVTVPGRGYRFVAAVSVGRGLIVQSETISQITIEQESEDDSLAIAASRVAPALPGAANQTRTQFFRTPLGLAALLLAGSLIVVVAVFGVRWIRASRAAANRFQHVKLRRLTNEGHVVNAAISPDGKFFVFIDTEKGKQSLRLGQTDGGSPIELRPRGDVLYRGLEFSDDGQNVYYASSNDRQAYALYRLPVLGGVPVKLRDNINPYFSLSPDQKRIAFLRGDLKNNTRSIVISNLDGSAESAVLTVPAARNLNSAGVSWSPDGLTLALAASPEDDETAVGIFLVQVGTGQLKPLTAALWRSISRLAWLKDGTGIFAVINATAAEENRQVWLAACPSGETRRITNDLFDYDAVLSLTADSNTVLTAEHQQSNNIWVAPTDDLSKARQLTFGATQHGLSGIAWTPKGRIVYTSVVGPSQTVWIMDADGANPKQLTSSGFDDGVVSVTGDGRYIVFTSNRSGGYEIWRMNIDGADARQLTTCGRNSEPNVSPDGKWIVYRSTCDASRALWRISIDGGPPVRMTDRAAAWPWISPDSKWIACDYSVEPGKNKLAVIPIEGGSPANLFDVAPSGFVAGGIRWTNDGKAVTYRDSYIGVWLQPLDGSPPQRVNGLPEAKIYAYVWSLDGKMLAFTRGVELRDAVLVSNAP